MEPLTELELCFLQTNPGQAPKLSYVLLKCFSLRRNRWNMEALTESNRFLLWTNPGQAPSLGHNSWNKEPLTESNNYLFINKSWISPHIMLRPLAWRTTDRVLTLQASPRWRGRPGTEPPNPRRKPSPRSSGRCEAAGRWRTWWETTA